MKKLTLLFCLLIAISSSAKVIFLDNFNITSDGGYINYQNDAPGRQTGEIATPINYSWYDNGSGNYGYPAVTNSGPYAGKAIIDPEKSLYGIAMSSEFNFKDYTNFSISYELTRTDSNSWQSIQIGKEYYHQALWTAGGVGFGIGEGFYQLWGSATGPTAAFAFAELTYLSNATLKIKLCVSQFADDTYISLFINDKPYPLSTQGGINRYVYKYTGIFTNNYITISSGGAQTFLIDNFKITTPDNEIATKAWTGDSDSGITDSVLYTHKINFATSTNITINGVTFEGSPSNMMAGANWELRTETPGGVFSAFDIYALFSNSFGVTPQSQFLITNILFNGVDSGGLTLTGLQPGKTYTIKLYGIGNDYLAPNGRPAFISTSDGGRVSLIDQNEFGANNGQILSYTYLAPESGVFSISASHTNIPNAVWVWYAFSNEISPPGAPAQITASQGEFSDKVVVSWTKINDADSYSLLRSTSTSTNDATVVSDAITTNVFDDTTVAQATYYYYWVKACNTGGCSALTGSALGYTSSANPPAKPTNISPVGFADESVPVTLTASAFSDPGGYSFSQSRWQLSDSSDFSSPSWDTDDTIPVNELTLPQNAAREGTNFWRVKYKNEFNSWSEWSDATAFILTSAPTTSAIIFNDTFSVTKSGNVNSDYTLPCRQSGMAAPEIYSFYGETKLGGAAAKPNKLELGVNAGCAPIHSFAEAANYKIEFDVQLHNFDNSVDWLSCSFGKNSSDDYAPWSESGMTALLFENSAFALYNDGLAVPTFSTIPTNKELHVTITASSFSFDEDEPVYCSVFIDGAPQIFENPKVNNHHLYYYTRTDDFKKNYVTFFNYNSAGSTTPSIIDDFKITAAPTNFIKVHQWTGDSDSLIDGTKTYTHLANFNGPNVDINGKTFIGTGTITNNDVSYDGMTTNGWTLHDSYAWVAFRTETPTAALSGNSAEIGRYGVIGAATIAVTLHGLSPYSSNTLYLYTQARGMGTDILFQNSYFGTFDFIDVDQFGEATGCIIEFNYLADKNGEYTVMASPKNFDNRFFLCGLANIETSTKNPELNVDCSLDFGEVVVSGSKTLSLEIKNLGAGELNGTISGFASPFSSAVSSYSATAATNDFVSVTFQPDDNISYTNVITLTGNGGTAQVSLYGTGVPEPCGLLLITLCLLGFLYKQIIQGI